MRKLFKNFKNLSTKQKIKLIISLPIILVAWFIDGLYEVGELIRKNLKLTIAILALVGIPMMAGYIMYETVPQYRGDNLKDAELYVYTNVHKMSNRFIVAEDGKIRGTKIADDSNIDKILSVLAYNKVDGRDYLIKSLVNYRNKNYKDAVKVHNFCWKKLKGKVGYAKDLKSRYK